MCVKELKCICVYIGAQRKYKFSLTHLPSSSRKSFHHESQHRHPALTIPHSFTRCCAPRNFACCVDLCVFATDGVRHERLHAVFVYGLLRKDRHSVATSSDARTDMDVCAGTRRRGLIYRRIKHKDRQRQKILTQRGDGIADAGCRDPIYYI